MRPKIGLLEEAFAGLRLGTFNKHHRFSVADAGPHRTAVNADIAALDLEIKEALLAPFRVTWWPGSMRSPGSA